MSFTIAALTLNTLVANVETGATITIAEANKLCSAKSKEEKAEVKAAYQALCAELVQAQEAAAAQAALDLEAAAAAIALQAQEAPKSTRKTTTLVKVATSSSVVNGQTVQRRNRECNVRAVAVFYSEELKLAWLGTHLGFGTKTTEGAMKIMATDTATGCLLPLQDAFKKNPESVKMELFAKDVEVGPALEAAKLEAYKKYMGEFTMLGRNLAKAADAAAAKAAKEAAKAAATPAQTEAEVKPEVVEEIAPEVVADAVLDMEAAAQEAMATA